MRHADAAHEKVVFARQYSTGAVVEQRSVGWPRSTATGDLAELAPGPYARAVRRVRERSVGSGTGRGGLPAVATTTQREAQGRYTPESDPGDRWGNAWPLANADAEQTPRLDFRRRIARIRAGARQHNADFVFVSHHRSASTCGA